MSPNALGLSMLCGSIFALGLALGLSPARADAGGDALLAGASGVAGGLTSDQLAAAARATSPALAARADERAAATADADQARAGYLPHLTLTARAVRLSDITPAPAGDVVVAPGAPEGLLAPGARLVSAPFRFPVLLDQTSFDAQLAVPVSDALLRIARGVAAADHRVDSARWTEHAQQRAVATDARLVYYAWARARLSVLVATDAVRQAELHLVDVERRAAADHASRADVLAVQAQRAAAEQQRVRAVDLARVAEAQVRIALHGTGPAGALDIGEPLATDLALADPGSDDALVAEAIGHRLELRAAGADIAALAEQARAAADAALPRLDLIGQLTDANPNPRYIPAEDAFHLTWSVGAQLTWAVGDVPGQLAQARGLRARSAAAAAQRAALVDALRAEVVAAAAAVRDAASAQVTSAQQLASAQESYRVRRALFQEGAATSTELTDAETALTRAQLDAVDARIDARVAAARLAHAIGHDGAEP